MKISVHGPVIVEEGKLLVTLDNKDSFYKLPGGRREENETGIQTCMREVMEETGLEIEILDELPVIEVKQDPRTGKPTDIELHHYRAKLKSRKESDSYSFNNHQVRWIPISDIRYGKVDVSPNIQILIKRGDIK